MSVQEILAGSGGILLVVMTLIQIAPIKVNPWSAIGKLIGKAINGDVLEKLTEVEAGLAKNKSHLEETKQKLAETMQQLADTKQTLDETKAKLEDHVAMDDQRYMDLHRARILQFNTDISRGMKHTKESFNDIMYNITCYEHYCDQHPEYPNNRAVQAIRNINRVYGECLKENSFLT